MSLSGEDKQWIEALVDRKVGELRTALFEKVRNPETPEALRLRRRASFLELDRIEAEIEAMRPHSQFGNPPADRT